MSSLAMSFVTSHFVYFGIWFCAYWCTLIVFRRMTHDSSIFLRRRTNLFLAARHATVQYNIHEKTCHPQRTTEGPNSRLNSIFRLYELRRCLRLYIRVQRNTHSSKCSVVCRATPKYFLCLCVESEHCSHHDCCALDRVSQGDICSSASVRVPRDALCRL